MLMPAARLSLRSLVRRPGYTAAALLLLTLGAGANTLVFSVVHSVLLKPLPYAAPDRLAAVWPDAFMSGQELDYLRERSRSFEQIASSAPGFLMALAVDGLEPIKVTGAKVSDNFFTLLGVKAE